MRKPVVSILIVAHEPQETLALALASVRSQTITDWECIIVDDGSPSRIETTVRRLRDERFRCITLDRNHGRGYARARALAEATGETICFLDSDDWMYPTRVESQLARARANPAAHFVACSLMVEDHDHRVLGIHDLATRRPTGASALGHLPVAFASLLMPTAAARQIGFDPDLTRAEDVLFLTQALKSPWAFVHSPQYVYRPSPPTRETVLESHRCTRLAYSRCRSEHPLRARRLELSFGLREIVHRLASERASRALTRWTRSRVLRPPTGPEREEHERSLAVVKRHQMESNSTSLPEIPQS